MARAGINKAQVQKAYQAVLALGQKPTIDTVRVQLGNTGSRTTISRYLKELKTESGAELGDTTLLSDTLKDLVARLAAQLQDEAHATIEQAQTQHDEERTQWKAATNEQQRQFSDAEARIGELNARLDSEAKRYETAEAARQAAVIESERLAQELADTKTMIAEKDRHMASLEEKHQHSRDSLKHFRQSAKDQREQDQRRHEHETQQLQADQRSLRDTLSAKQTDITQLNKENAKLTTTLSQHQTQQLAANSTLAEAEKQRSDGARQIESLNKKLIALETEHKSVKRRADDSQNALEHELSELKANHEQLKVERDQLEHDRQAAQLDAARLSTELTVKNEFIDNLTQLASAHASESQNKNAGQ